MWKWSNKENEMDSEIATEKVDVSRNLESPSHAPVHARVKQLSQQAWWATEIFGTFLLTIWESNIEGEGDFVANFWVNDTLIYKS